MWLPTRKRRLAKWCGHCNSWRTNALDLGPVSPQNQAGAACICCQAQRAPHGGLPPCAGASGGRRSVQSAGLHLRLHPIQALAVECQAWGRAGSGGGRVWHWNSKREGRAGYSGCCWALLLGGTLLGYAALQRAHFQPDRKKARCSGLAHPWCSACTGQAEQAHASHLLMPSRTARELAAAPDQELAPMQLAAPCSSNVQ